MLLEYSSDIVNSEKERKRKSDKVTNKQTEKQINRERINKAVREQGKYFQTNDMTHYMIFLTYCLKIRITIKNCFVSENRNKGSYFPIHLSGKKDEDLFF